MSRLSQINPRKLIAALKRRGFEEYGLFKKILKQSGISEEEFRELL